MPATSHAPFILLEIVRFVVVIFIIFVARKMRQPSYSSGPLGATASFGAVRR
jgi:hypothetical protein